MSNVTTGQTWYLDAVGVIWNYPVQINKIVLLPNAAGDEAIFKWYDLGTPLSAGCGSGTGTITGTNTLTSTGNLSATIKTGMVFEIVASSGSADNLSPQGVLQPKKRYRVYSDASANAVVVEDKWTNEASKVYQWKTYSSYYAAHVKKDAITDATGTIEIDFSPWPLMLPNLILDTLTTNAVVYLHIR